MKKENSFRLKAIIEHIIKHNYVVQRVYRSVLGWIIRFWGLLISMDDNLILMNGHGFRYNDSPRAIYEQMIVLGLDKKYSIVWALNDPMSIEIPGNCRKIKMDTLHYFYTALKAKYWISCVNIERGLVFKKRNTKYLNTWHGASLNYVGNAVNGRNDFNFEHIDYFCYNGEYEREFIKRDFNVRDDSLLPIGYPRNDLLYHVTNEQIKLIKESLGIPYDKKVILYAPTWRESNDGGKTYNLTPPIDWEKWEKTLGDNYLVFLRTHPYTTKLMNVGFNSFVRDYCDYPNVNDLLIVADILISDYSCIQLDYSILARPQICFGYDFDTYKKERGFYFDLEMVMPNGVARNENEVLKWILTMDYNEECLKSKRFCDEHMEYGGNATNICISKMFGSNSIEL